MCFYRENQLFAKRASSKLTQVDKSNVKEEADHEKQVREEVVVEDQLSKKKKLLDEKAPGLFDHLVKLSQEDLSTEATTPLDSDLEGEEGLQNIFASTPIKIEEQFTHCDLSNVVSVRINQFFTESFLTPAFENPVFPQTTPFGDIVEETQRRRILNLMTENTFLMNTVFDSQGQNQKNINKCLEDLRSFKAQINENNQSQLQKIEQIKEQKKNSHNFENNPTPANLYHHFFGSGKNYRYEIQLDNSLPSPIFRERNLVLKFKVFDIMTKQPMKNLNRIVLHLSMHTWEIPSSPITRNKTGNKAIMGDTEVDIKNGEAVFDRIQINEVTSKFIHGHVAFLIVPSKPSNLGTSLTESSNGENDIDIDWIKPLMLEKIVVKSKKKNTLKKQDE